jgi:hypothetical protein
MDDFQATTERFLTWFKSVGGEFRDDLLEIKDFRAKDAGRGISKSVATLNKSALTRSSRETENSRRYNALHHSEGRYHQHRDVRAFRKITWCI